MKLNQLGYRINYVDGTLIAFIY